MTHVPVEGDTWEMNVLWQTNQFLLDAITSDDWRAASPAHQASMDKYRPVVHTDGASYAGIVQKLSELELTRKFNAYPRLRGLCGSFSDKLLQSK
jgi:hypothetical protein